jgi:hypothetical protein
MFMKKILSFFLACTSLTAFAKITNPTENFAMGNADIKSINAITFAPQSILLIGDSKSATITAIDLSAHPKADNSKVNLAKVDEKIGQTLGASIADFEISDMAINPENGNIYFSVVHNSGSTALLRLNGESFENVALDNVSFSSLALEKPVPEGLPTDRRNQRKWAISDLEYTDGTVMVSGLSTEEFGSTFRSIPYPFKAEQKFSALEIYHAAHGKYETQAPIKSFVQATVNGKPSLIAGYTCTPIVVFPLENLEPGKKFRGRTVAELGNWNTPTDMISMSKNGNDYILIANTARNVMKIKISDIEKFQGSLSTKVLEPSGTDGIPFVSLPFVQVQQLAKYNADKYVLLQRNAKGILVLNIQDNNML